MGLPRLLEGRYRVDRRLARGGMGTVYEAADTALERRVAVKVIRDDLVGSAEAAERFRREARAAAGFAHPNVVTVHDFGLAAGTRAFLVMELLHGATLREELRREKRLAPPRALAMRWPTQRRRGRGLSRRSRPRSRHDARRQVGQRRRRLPPLQQKASRLSPEQLRGAAATPAWDLWALAVVAYEMMTGAHPYAGGTLAELYRDVAVGHFIPVTTNLPEAPPRWQKFFEHTFAPEPEHRPRSASLFLAELESALA